MSEKRPLISIIVPVYQVEAYLECCVKSICKQIFSDFELILVDDGSPDRCPQLCDALARMDPRIRVIHQENRGLSGARNAGLDVARGSYIGFVDSDDYIKDNMYQRLYEELTRMDADVAVCSYEVVQENGRFRDDMSNLIQNRVMTGMEVMSKIGDPEGLLFIVSWNKLYRRRIFENIRFEEGKLNEDLRIFNSIFCRTKKVACIKEPLYCYRSSSDSIMRGRASLRQLDHPEAFYQCFMFYKEKGWVDLLAPAEGKIFAKLSALYYELPKQDRRSERMKEVRQMQWNAVSVLRTCHKLSLRTLVRTVLFQETPWLYLKLKKIKR